MYGSIGVVGISFTDWSRKVATKTDELPATDTADEAVDAPEMDIAALVDEVQSSNPVAYELLRVIHNYYNEMNDARAKLKSTSSNVSEFREALKKSEDPDVIEIRNAMEVIQKKLKELRDRAAVRMNFSLSGSLSEEERANLKTLVSQSRASGRNASTAFRQFADNIPGVKDFSYIVDAMFPERQESTGTKTAKSGNEDLNAIREWARKNGKTVSSRGRIAQDVKDAYAKAMATQNSDSDPDEVEDE